MLLCKNAIFPNSQYIICLKLFIVAGIYGICSQTTTITDAWYARTVLNRIPCHLYDYQYSEDALAEAEFWDVIGTKVFRVFLRAIHSHLYSGILPPPAHPPPPPAKVV